MDKKNIIFVGVLVVVLILMVGILGFIYWEIQSESKEPYQGVSEDGSFSTSFIRVCHEKAKNENYLVSPYSVEYALSMLREGALGSSLEEMEKVVPKRSIKTLTVKEKVNVANAVFIKDIYKNNVRSDFMKRLDEQYNADVIYDSFIKPDKINEWVNQKTNKMIPQILDTIDSEFIMGIANAVAFEEEWLSPFICDDTVQSEFTSVDGKKQDVAMMNQYYESMVGYYSDDESEVVTIPYKMYQRTNGKEVDENGEQLEFVGILPNDLDSYIQSFDLERIKKIETDKKYASEDFNVSIMLPRFEFSYDFEQFKNALIDMGIQEVFSDNADLSGMLAGVEGAYVSKAIHKTYVKVDENGTKAAAVTYFGIDKNSAVAVEKDFVSVVFNKPFIFMIKDTQSNEILFFGVVYEPEKWDASKTC